MKKHNNYFETKDLKLENGKIINNNNIKKLIFIINEKIKDHYKNVKKIYFMDNNLKNEEGYTMYLNNKKCLFLHLPLHKYENTEIIKLHFKIKEYFKKYVQAKLDKKELFINNKNLYKLQFYLNMKFIYLFNYIW